MIARRFKTYFDAVRNIQQATQIFNAKSAERWEGTMYVAYDCSQNHGRNWVEKNTDADLRTEFQE